MKHTLRFGFSINSMIIFPKWKAYTLFLKPVLHISNNTELNIFQTKLGWSVLSLKIHFLGHKEVKVRSHSSKFCC